jgi:predicted DNA binding CopG/RHH family protein
MSAKIKYTNEPIGEPRVIKDFLPAPSELAFRDEDVKITITLSKKSVDFFKSEAAKADTQYQRMIRRLLDVYVEAHARKPAPHVARGRSKAARAV